MVPWGVGVDPRLKHVDIRIYFVLAACRRGSKVTIGTRLIAKYACTSQRRVVDAIARLKSYGYLKADDAKNGTRAVYHLTEPRFSGRQKAQAEETPNVEHQVPEPMLCPKCHKRCHGLLKVGWCRSCGWKNKVQHIVREEMARSECA